MPHKLELEKIPFAQLSALGVTKTQFLALPSIILSALLSGKRTPLLIFSHVALSNGLNIRDLPARISIADTGGEEYAFRIHTRLYQLPCNTNVFQLSDDQILMLQSDDNPILLCKSQAGRFQRNYLVQYDKVLNDLHIQVQEAAPESINGHALTSEQQKEFSLGQYIETPMGKIRRDFNSPLGYIGDFLVLPNEAYKAGEKALIEAISSTYISINNLYTAMNIRNDVQGDNGHPPVIAAPDKGFLLQYSRNALKAIDELSKKKGKGEPEKIDLLKEYRQKIKALASPAVLA